MVNRFIVLLMAILPSGALFSQTSLTSNGKFGLKHHNITISIRLDTVQSLDSLKLEFEPIGIPGAQHESISTKPVKNEAVWKIYSDYPVTVYTRDLIKNQISYWMIEPGDSIVAEFKRTGIKFFGKGSEKLRLRDEMDSVQKTIEKPKNAIQWETKSLTDFLDMHRYSMRRLKLLLPLVDSYKEKLSAFAYNTIRVNTITRVQEDKLDKFSGLVRNAETFGISRKDLCDIFDSCFYNEPFKWVLSNHEYGTGWYAFIRWQIRRKYEFQQATDSMRSEPLRKYLYYKQGKETYFGLALQRFLLDLIADHTIHEMGFTSETEQLLTKYYNDPDVYPQYKQYVKAYELKRRELIAGKLAPDFSLIDTEGRSFNKDRLKGKIAVLDFWFTGCVGCVQMTPALRRIEEHFKGDSNIVFLSISTDKNKSQWLKSIKQGKYCTGNGTNLYTGGEGNEHHMMTRYSIGGYPTIHLIDPFGRIIENPLPDPRSEPEKLIKLIEKQSLLMKDGPYVIYDDKTATALSINFSRVSRQQLDKKARPMLMVQADKKDKSFVVALKSVLEVEPCEYSQPRKLLVLSDIEGNFDAFRELLQSNGVIDSNYNWIFENGHLVFNGDMFDRGNQVTECLWLIYSLEEKAKKANGHVHFILGNHEIMNLSGDDRYVQQKYKENALMVNKKYVELYDNDSELGKWLRTKNIIEKIGNLLFTHAGISNEVNGLSFSIRQLNELARPYYDNDSLAKVSTNLSLKVLFDAKTSPFWYRLYYQSGPWKAYPSGDTVYKASMTQVNETLKKFGVDHIITGHTIVADTISVHFDNKVINVDTRHSEAKSEALLIEGENYYRVNTKGNRFLLFNDNFRKTANDSANKPSQSN